MNKKKIQVLFILSWFFILIALLPSCRGNYTRSIDCDRDSWVDKYNGDTNYGGTSSVTVGDYFFGPTQAYYHFDNSNAESGWIEMEIYLYFFYASSTVDVGVGISSNNWSELTITWNNQPGNGTYIGYMLNTGVPFTIPVDVNDFTNGEITITLYGRRGGSDGYLAGPTREGALLDSDIPRIIFTYEGVDPIIITWIFIAVITISSIVGLTVFLLKTNKKKFAARVMQPPLPATQIKSISARSPGGTICTECGTQVVSRTNFCTNCGALLKYD